MQSRLSELRKASQFSGRTRFFLAQFVLANWPPMVPYILTRFSYSCSGKWEHQGALANAEPQQALCSQEKTMYEWKALR